MPHHSLTNTGIFPEITLHFFQDGDRIPPQIWVRSTTSCLSSMSDLEFRHYKWELDMFSCTISWNSVCNETCQMPPDSFVSDSLWIWEAFVPKTALAQCQVNVLLTKLNHISTSIFSISISFMLEKISEKQLIIWEIFFFFFFSF